MADSDFSGHLDFSAHADPFVVQDSDSSVDVDHEDAEDLVLVVAFSVPPFCWIIHSPVIQFY